MCRQKTEYRFGYSVGDVAVSASCLGFFCRGNVDAASVAVEEHAAVHKGEDGVVAAHAHALAGVPFGAALADDDVASDNDLSTEFLHAKTLAARVASIAYGTLTFLMSHI